MSSLKLIAAIIVAALAFLTVGSSASAQTKINQKVPPKKPTIVAVLEGDTLTSIADNHKTTWPRLFDANPSIDDPDIIHPGDQVRIPETDEN